MSSRCSNCHTRPLALGLLLFGMIVSFAVPGGWSAGIAESLPASPSWSFEAVDAPRWFAQMGPRSLAVDEAGIAHIVYGGDHLYHAQEDRPGWRFETVDPAPGAGKYAALALAGAGAPHIGYYDAGAGQVKYARWGSGAWQLEVVEASVQITTPVALALDASGRPHLSYRDASGLKYADRDADGWHVAVVDASAGEGVALALDAAGYPLIAYGDGALKVARWTGAAWEFETVDAADTEIAKSIAFDSSGRPCVAYTGFNAGGRRELRYARRLRGGWDLQFVDAIVTRDTGLEPSLAFDKTGAPRISYGAYDSLKYARWTGSDWVRERVELTPGRYTALVVDGAGTPHISYLSGGRVRFARRPGLNWQIETVDTARTTGFYTALALDGAGTPHISYRDNEGGALRYAHRAGAGWLMQEVDSTLGLAAPTSLALDGAGQPQIAYAVYPDSGTRGALKLARWTGSGWSLQTIDTDIGSLDQAGARQPALRIDSAGQPYVSYFDGGQVLKLAHWTGSAWVIESVAGPGQFGDYTSLALDSQDQPHLVYQDAAAERLIYAYRAGAGWINATVDVGLYVGGHHALGLDRAGNPHICYTAYTGMTVDLRYARLAADEWQVQTVDAGAPYTGYFCSLALDGADRPHIGYYDEAQRDLRYARWTGSAWELQTVDVAGDAGTFAALALDQGDRPHISYHDATSGDLKLAVFGQESPTPTTTATATATETQTPEPTATPTAAATATPTETSTPEPSATATWTPEPTPTETPDAEWRRYLPLALREG